MARKIFRRIILNYLGLGVLPLVIVSLILIGLTEDTVQKYLFQRNMETARRASNEIAAFINEPLTILNTLAQTRDIVEMERFTQSRVISKIKYSHAIFRKLFILDQSGVAVVTTSFGEELRNYSRENFFRAAIQGNEFFSQVFFTPSRFPVMYVALPIRRYSSVEGVLVGEIDLKNIWDLVDKITIGNTGNAFLISADGSVIAHPDKQLVLQRESFSGYPFFQDLLNMREGISQYVNEGTEVIATFAPIAELNWGIVVQQSEKEALELARKMRDRVVVLVALTTLLALVLAVTSIKRITQPLEVLVKGVQEYAHGNLNHRITLTRQDELAELATEFNAMAESLDVNQKKLRRMERLAALSRFASLVSHEIRNPLNAMNINMQILRRLITRVDTPPEKKMKYLDIISSEINRMNSLVTNFLAISRPPELVLIRSDVHQILEDVFLLQEAHAASSGISIERQYVKRQPAFGMYDHNQLKQVFHNIIVNAFEAMPNGGRLHILTKTRYRKGSPEENGRLIRIEFADSGPGIPRQKQSEIFEFYYTTKRTGTGLGLAIAKQIIEAHGGTIRIRSKEGEGTTVILELPVEN
ncbi:MAG: cache domain-containing protein [Calditrichia bacterium]